MELGSWQVRTLFTQGTLGILSFERQVSIKKRTVREPERRNKSWLQSKISQHNFNKPKVQTPQAHVYSCTGGHSLY